MIVELHSDVLLHVSDLFARGVKNKFGLLLGYGLDDRLVVVKPIELAQVDPQYLEKRYSLFKDVYPNLSLVGVYEIGGNNPDRVNMLDISFEPRLYLSVDESIQFKSFVEGNLVKTVIESSETEVITTKTIDSSKDYTKGRSKEDLTVAEFNQNMTSTLTKLYERLNKILETEGMDREIVEIANALRCYKHVKQPTDTKLQVAELALITEQIAELESAKIGIAKKILVKEPGLV
ncbi:conserved hypothetical protein [Candida dubliniensis CD36]|uniref:JAB1/MPN/MOV34 metalloenzyme domain-containing protein n=1 Tax=Candida dubliniensis (strain CD36 / ATCC MYA-646 / CBS 7987 / NCPF 3949 / NRRL Y-17841) TaxID=573826 RepID=B9WJE2_CANDC|nr:conserved hypothetical protein [Candida dubliniensis CD36]CAX41365.1 conserved hypothetical protein [Candida dubliniensis CD36]